MTFISVRGARTHNLKDISLDIPRHKLVVITGFSGSGKSSLAFDTLYAEGQRRYVESLSAYARQFLQLMEKPDVDAIEGLSPAIAIDQKSTSHNPRSTVGTVTEIHDYLRLLYARVGTPHCPHHPEKSLNAQSISQMVDTILETYEGERTMLLAPVVENRKGAHLDVFASLQAQGFLRFQVQTGNKPPNIFTAEEVPELVKNEKHSISVVIDRLRVSDEQKQRITESIETALRIGDGRMSAVSMDEEDKATAFSNRYACPECGYALMELEPRLFSFNNPVGACETCDGLGTELLFDVEKIVAYPHLSVAAGAIKGWDRRNPSALKIVYNIARHYEVDIEQPFEKLPQDFQKILLYGSGKEKIPLPLYGSKTGTSMKTFEGIVTNYQRRYHESDNLAVKEELSRYISKRTCNECNGARLKAAARHVLIAEQPIHTIEDLSLQEALDFFKNLTLKGHIQTVADRIVKEIMERLHFLNAVGLEYLSLSRSAETLSGGESQRIRLASQIGSGLTGVMYVLDEPSIGLHQSDNQKLIKTLKHLRDLGNSVIVVEHDEEIMHECDHIIDMGPAAGLYGGNVVAQGTIEEVKKSNSSTADYLSERKVIPLPKKRVSPEKGKEIVIKGASGNNLRNVTCNIPIGLFTCVSGVSGSGKSTLINDTLHAAVARELHRSSTHPSPHKEILGLEAFDKVIAVDQSPIGRTPRSNPATYTALFTLIRDLFAAVPLARERGYSAGRFSFNVAGGRCENCQGDGLIKVAMHFLPDLYVPCDVCQGKRYNRETLEVLYKGKNIAEILMMSVAEARDFFDAIPPIVRKLDVLMQVGLSYIKLGQSATTLSGGEAQRVKLSLELSKRATGNTLYILDEPTTGLHFHDIDLLLKVIFKLRDKGNTIIVIEHNLDVIKSADWVIDMGPKGGKGGGVIVARGSPEAVAKNAKSVTGPFLRKMLGAKK